MFCFLVSHHVGVCGEALLTMTTGNHHWKGEKVLHCTYARVSHYYIKVGVANLVLSQDWLNLNGPDVKSFHWLR